MFGFQPSEKQEKLFTAITASQKLLLVTIEMEVVGMGEGEKSIESETTGKNNGSFCIHSSGLSKRTKGCQTKFLEGCLVLLFLFNIFALLDKY